jgi:predicted amidohydrolase YtcJ
MTAQSVDVSSGADLIVFGAQITTQNPAKPEASALAVKRERIYAVGSDADILSLKDENTRIIDAGGRRLIPGLNDAHIHVLNERSYNYNVRWEGVPTLTHALEMLSEQAQRTPDGQWVKVIGGWSPYQFEERRHPTVEELSKAVPDRPLLVLYAYNRAFLNDPAMDALGVGTPKFPMVPGTVLETDEAGHSTGVITGYSYTFATVLEMLPQASFDEQVSSLMHLVNDLNRFGITSVTDAAGFIPYPEGHAHVEELARNNRLNIRLSFIDIGGLTDPNRTSLVDAHIEGVTRKAPISPGENIHPFMAHGHEYEGMGEAFRLELHDHENFDMPPIIIDQEAMRRSIKEDVTKLVERRIPFRMHISYNENITPFLDALEEVNLTKPFDGLRWAIEHAETITPENMQRVKALGGAIALDDKMALHGDAFITTYSREKALQTPRLRTLMESGVPLALTSDGYRASSYNPWVGLGWSVSGKSVSGSEVLATDNRLSREEALTLYTLGAAWFQHQEHEKGRIAPGHLADFALLSSDYFTVPDDEIKNLSSVLTVVGGRVVFGTGTYHDEAPELPEARPEWAPIKYFGGSYMAK